MADVFLSYKREDAARVRKLVAALRKAGLDVWWDEDIPPSAPWEATIEEALRDAKTVIVCWSPASVASENVRSEARLAREDGRLIQVFVRPCDPPLFFGERQGIDLSAWRGSGSDPRIAEIIRAVDQRTSHDRSEAPKRPFLASFPIIRAAVAAAALFLVVGGGLGWWILGAAKAEGPTTLAVLPFRALDPADASLVDAIWDDTRGAISHNPNLRVLGREAVSKLAKEDLSPTDYRRKIGADYLLDGSVEHVGDQVRMKLSLVRTTDGVEVWSDQVGGKLDDVFSFQQRIASEVEGRIRGRVAPGGGTTAKNIATTGEVYALYAEAKAKVRKRDADDAAEAANMLRKAVAMDPNYAPAWAELGLATFFSQSFQRPTFEVRPEAIKDLRRALILAPNLGYAHAALAMVQNFPPESEGDLRRAIALDPGNAEAWAWLGNLFSNQNRLKEALEAENHAVEIEPMLWTAVGNKVAILTTMGDESGVAQELARIERLRDPALLAKARGRISIATGHPGEAIRIWLELRRGHPEEAPWVDQRIGSLLIELGFIDEGVSARRLPLSFAAEFRGTPVPALVLDRNYETPMGFWQDSEMLALYGRLLPNSGRVKEYVARYKRAFGTADDFMAAFAERLPVLQSLAPTIVCNLQAGGDSADADAILRRVEPTVLSYLKNGPPTAGLLAQVGFYEAAAGQDNDAVRFLAEGVSRGALPDGEGTAIDIAQEPCFAHLANRADFQAIRRRIFARLAEERGKVPQPLLAQIYPVRSKASA